MITVTPRRTGVSGLLLLVGPLAWPALAGTGASSPEQGDSGAAPARPAPCLDTLEAGPEDSPRWVGEHIDLSLRDADLVEVLRSFAKLGKFNLVLDPKVKGTVTVELKDVPWDAALAVILRTHGLAAEVEGRVVAVGPSSISP